MAAMAAPPSRASHRATPAFVIGAAAILAACAAPPPPAPLDAAALAARLPAGLAGFERREMLPLAGNAGREVAYATPGRVAAAAAIEVDEPVAGTNGPDAGALERLVELATQGPQHRRLAVRARLNLPLAGAPRFACAALDGRLGRERVTQLVCAGTIAGAASRLRVAMPWRDPPLADAEAFATEAAAALAGPG